MQAKRWMLLLGLWSAMGWSQQVTSAASAKPLSLWSAYRRSLEHDPTLRLARAQWLASKEAPTLARSALLPHIAADGSVRHVHQRADGTTLHNRSHQYGVTLEQTLVNGPDMMGYGAATWARKAAKARWHQAQQDARLRLAERYLGVLTAHARLEALRLEQRATARALADARHRLDAGMATVQDVAAARAHVQLVVAQRVAAEAGLLEAKAVLSTLIDAPCDALLGLGASLPLRPVPMVQLSRWIHEALEHSWWSLAMKADVSMAHWALRQAMAGHFPVATLQGSWHSIHDGRPAGLSGGAGAPSHYTLGTLGVTASLPLSTGGQLSSRVRQQQARLEAAIAALGQHQRAVRVGMTRAVTGVNASIEQVRASYRAIVAGKQAFQHNLAAYRAGTGTMVDVLYSLAQLGTARRQYAESRHAYVLSGLRLRLGVGKLRPCDLKVVNRWLVRPVRPQ